MITKSLKVSFYLLIFNRLKKKMEGLNESRIIVKIESKNKSKLNFIL